MMFRYRHGDWGWLVKILIVRRWCFALERGVFGDIYLSQREPDGIKFKWYRTLWKGRE